ncbi:MAG: NADH-quinone oxidoreductase subunit [Chitinophagaceae bacterium]|nr:NADH-quinone oxidoreductase subunit [Chitinophagaceae bacterium]
MFVWAFLLTLTVILLYAVVVVYAERKAAAFVQDRLGPLEVGPKGLLQTVADLLKLLQKEDIIPNASDKILFRLAPWLIFIAIFCGFIALPWAPGLVGSDLPSGIFMIFAVVSLDVIGLFMVGWGANNKYALFGAVRSIAQIISYEIPLGLCLLAVVTFTGTLNLQEIAAQQALHSTSYLFGIPAVDVSHWGGIFAWNIIRFPVLIPVAILFFITTLAECNRAPFDIPEAESELVAGFHTEYSGFRFGMLFLSEYAMMLLVALLLVFLFLGAWHSPLPNIAAIALCDWTSGAVGHWSAIAWSVFWLGIKTMTVVFWQIMLRWTFPRLRVDQLMHLCWKLFLPLSMLLVLTSAVWKWFLIA